MIKGFISYVECLVDRRDDTDNHTSYVHNRHKIYYHTEMYVHRRTA